MYTLALTRLRGWMISTLRNEVLTEGRGHNVKTETTVALLMKEVSNEPIFKFLRATVIEIEDIT